ncbi:MAG: hypothetical protein F6J98_15775 [Moorea sp. SIO4G2]|uniref:Uncharacterized protein n=1 Tax=Moorena bouillonii PNG TaxID=568701 RepID=A0A1U7MYA3_9CYAN|nr:hypothetical protein [Moorena bouillonii]NEO61808.1 hypothetical protein [Moorena sp. SIO4G2]OLT58705.1 hypothetical protein BJP37_06245 [Moorena bouillonii PNG]
MEFADNPNSGRIPKCLPAKPLVLRFKSQEDQPLPVDLGGVIDTLLDKHFNQGNGKWRIESVFPFQVL